MTKIQQRVQRGIAWLNKKYGIGWHRRIVLGRLDMSNGQYCIIGQLDEDYVRGLNRLGIEAYGSQYPVSLGLIGGRLRETYDYPVLTREWLVQLRALRRADREAVGT